MRGRAAGRGAAPSPSVTAEAGLVGERQPSSQGRGDAALLWGCGAIQKLSVAEQRFNGPSFLTGSAQRHPTSTKRPLRFPVTFLLGLGAVPASAAGAARAFCSPRTAAPARLRGRDRPRSPSPPPATAAPPPGGA